MHDALEKTERPIVFSISNDGFPWLWGPSVGANLWRTDVDMSDDYLRMAYLGFGQNGLERFCGSWVET